MATKHKITIIGSGNVAWHLAFAFKKAGVEIVKIISRNIDHAKELATCIDCAFGNNLNDISVETNLLFICVPDSAIPEIVSKLANNKIPVAHTAGSVPLSVFGQNIFQSGVFYPFQTFTKNIRLGEVKFPVLIEASSNEMNALLSDLANEISDTVISMDSENRKKIHLAGVIANNFANYFYTQAYEYLESQTIEPTLLNSLIEETSQKIKYSHPAKNQTGPAVRNDLKTLEAHKALLSGNPNLRDLYIFISQNLMDYYNIQNG
jgi:predicted short-subunit dehydrogenase-like oxidoreductase (DUF2520 family)